MTQAKRILIVEDELDLAEIIADYLRKAGMEAEILSEGTHAVETILAKQPDLVVLDIMLPGKDGLDICREVRAKSDVPIIMETAKVEEIDRLLGLELGADDYLCKPFSPRELVARIKAILRRSTSAAAEERVEDALVLDEETWRARLYGKPLELTRQEFRLLQVLYKRPNRVFSRAQLLDLAFRDDRDVIDRTIDSHIKNIRIKTKAIAPGVDLIRSVYGVGYAFGD
ncbi:response regulator [Phaeovulum sp.]|uniref:response regulator n=1 Tax=Phaeovulum sp. TaxID=2934796 RepID=UPI00356831EF